MLSLPGMAERCMELMVERGSNRRPFGKRILEHVRIIRCVGYTAPNAKGITTGARLHVGNMARS